MTPRRFNLTGESRLIRWSHGGLVTSRPHGDLMSRPEPEFAENVFDVHFGGALADHELLGDVAVTESAGDECHDLLFAHGKGRCGGSLLQAQGACESRLHPHRAKLRLAELQVLEAFGSLDTEVA
jgi:hypothetical protein